MTHVAIALVSWDNVKSSLKDGHIDWRAFLDERQLKEVGFSTLYANEFAHGTEGHNSKLIIAKMTQLLDLISQNIEIKVE